MCDVVGWKVYRSGKHLTALYKKSSKFLAERNPDKPTACIQIWCMIRDANLQLVAKVTGNFHSMDLFGEDGRALLSLPTNPGLV